MEAQKKRSCMILMKMMGTPEEDLFAALGRKHPGLMGNWKRLPYPMEKKPTCSFCEKQFLDQPHAKPTEEHTLRMGAGGSMCVFCVNGGRAATWHQRQAEWTEEQRVQALAASMRILLVFCSPRIHRLVQGRFECANLNVRGRALARHKR